MSAPLQIGLLLFPKLTQLDLTGPLQVFSSLPGAKLHLIWKRIEPVPSDSVMMLTPTATFTDCPQLDVICVPGGVGTDDMVNDAEMLDFLRRQAEGAKYVTSVCTGSLILGAAGLLRGYRATTHWTAMELLAPFGAIPTKTRVCIDRNRVTGGGVTAGDRFRADAGLDPDRPSDRGGNPAQARIQPGAAIRRRLARHSAAPSPHAPEGKRRAPPRAPQRGQRPRRCAARVTFTPSFPDAQLAHLRARESATTTGNWISGFSPGLPRVTLIEAQSPGVHG
jgi:cyclohexyl-isocyanide hydratase